MRMRTITIAAVALSAFSTTAWAQNVPPKELQVPRLFCNRYPADTQATLNVLPAGGKWERINAKSFVYGVRSADPLTNRVNEYRYQFIREDNPLACGDQTPSCIVLNRVAQNGFELRPYQYNQFCAALLMNVGMSQPGMAEAMEKEARATASAASAKQLDTVNGSLRAEGSLVMLNGRELFIDTQAADISIHGRWPSSGPAKYALLTVSSGGTACPAQYRLVDAATRQATDAFGNCSDVPKVTQEGDGLLIDFPAFREAGAESYRFEAGRLKQLK